MPFNRIQVFSGTNTVFGSTVTTSDVIATPGNLVIAIAEADTVAQNGITIADNKSNTWSRLISTSLASTFDLEIWYSVITTGGSGYHVTATDNGGGVDSLIICEEWAGSMSVPQDQSVGATGVANPNANSGASTAITQSNELVIGAVVAGGNDTLTLGAGYSNLTQVNTNFSTLGFESKLVNAIAAQTVTFTINTGVSWVCQVGTFKQLSVANLALLGTG